MSYSPGFELTFEDAINIHLDECWQHQTQTCVGGPDLGTHPNKTVEECKRLCKATRRCRAFEYGVTHVVLTTKPTNLEIVVLEENMTALGVMVFITTLISTFRIIVEVRTSSKTFQTSLICSEWRATFLLPPLSGFLLNL